MSQHSTVFKLFILFCTKKSASFSNEALKLPAPAEQANESCNALSSLSK